MSRLCSAEALEFLRREGPLLQAYCAQVCHADDAEFPLALGRLSEAEHAEALAYYGACWFGGSFFFKLLSDEWLDHIPDQSDYDAHVDHRSDFDRMLPSGYDYHFYLETEHEGHHFAVIAPAEDRRYLLSSYDDVFLVERLKETLPEMARRLLVERDADYYRRLFGVPYDKRDRAVYSRGDLWFRQRPLRYPTKRSILELIERLARMAAAPEFALALAKDRQALEKQGGDPSTLQTPENVLAGLKDLSDEAEAM